MDLFSIGRSKTRKGIFQLYFSHPEKKYYLRELERKLGFPVQNIRRELIKLEKTGIFKRHRSGKQVYYYLNKESPIYGDISNIISKTIGLEVQLRQSLKKVGGIKKAFIYGSFSSGTQDSLSDIDIIIVGDIEEDELIEKIIKLEQRFEREINYQVYSPGEFKKKMNDKSSFVSKVLSGSIIILVNGNERN